MVGVRVLEGRARELRVLVLDMLHEAKSGHAGGSLGLADIFSVLYFDIMKHNPKKPLDPKRDFLFLSNGHTCPILYASLSLSGYFKTQELFSLRKLGSRLQGHPHFGTLPGVENSGGPLAQGISQAVGLASSLKRDGKKNKVFCIVGDGEMQEGECYEAMLFAHKEKLDNLYVIVDVNNMQIDGKVEDILDNGNFSEKFKSFGFRTIDFNGNDIIQIKHAFKHAFEFKGKPVCLIAKTIPGKGVSFMEDDFHWHGKVPNDEELVLALKELNVK